MINFNIFPFLIQREKHWSILILMYKKNSKMIKISLMCLLFSFSGCDSSQGNSGGGTVITPPVLPPVVKLTDEELMDIVQKQTFAYFWDYAPHF
jgi:hypothetical protein